MSNLEKDGRKFCGILVQLIEEVVLNETSGIVKAVEKNS